MTSLPVVTFGIVNCNRLHYLRSCFESLEVCTRDYPNREFIVVDNASVEPGTAEYLEDLDRRGVRVFQAEERDPHNEFARGLNLICREATGDFICPLQGDMQFVVQGGWLRKYVDFLSDRKNEVGCITFDAQRRVTNESQAAAMSYPVGDPDFPFVLNRARPPVSGAAEVMYSREVLNFAGPWSEDNLSHEGTGDSETDMIARISSKLEKNAVSLVCASPVIPVAVAIYTDLRGTQGRIRGGRRYGHYVPPPVGFSYYEMVDIWSGNPFRGRKIPVSIEEIARPLLWPIESILDGDGSWKKNPIRPESAGPHDFVLVDPSVEEAPRPEAEHVSEWLEG